MNVAMKNTLTQEDKQIITRLFSHDLANLESALDQEMLKEYAHELQARKRYASWVAQAVETLSADRFPVSPISPEQLLENLEILRQTAYCCMDDRTGTQIAISSNLASPLYTNEPLLCTALHNLIKNSMEANRQEFQIQITITRGVKRPAHPDFAPGQEDAGEYVAIAVKDNGIGFASHRQQLFETPQHIERGGFGLYYVSRVCSQLHCILDIASGQGRTEVTLFHPSELHTMLLEHMDTYYQNP